MKTPLFPLRTVLYPGGPLPLRIFESRYLDMISRSMKKDEPFGVLLIRDGSEIGRAKTYSIGTLAKIIDWYQGSDGVLGVTAVGTTRFRCTSEWRQADGLLMGDIELLIEPPACVLPEEHGPLADILERVIDDLDRLYAGLDKHYNDAGWVSYRLAEILPISPDEKQVLLETDDPIKRLESMQHAIQFVRSDQPLPT